MSRLTPSKPGTDAELENALDILASRTWTCAQLSKLIRALTVDDSDGVHAPSVDDMADEFYTADLNNRRDANKPECEELPTIGATISRDDQPVWMRAFNDLSIGRLV
jgi:hypothetical protein